jgi:hypothetical protein
MATWRLQVFSLPTKSPHGLNIESNDDKSDDIFWLAIVERLASREPGIV